MHQNYESNSKFYHSRESNFISYIFQIILNLMSKVRCDIEYMFNVPYFSAIGSFMYVMVCSRPNLSHSLSVVSRFMANTGKKHWRSIQ